MTASMKHPQSGLIKPVPLGFSWTVFFFGGFPPLLRGDLKWAVIMWAVWASAGVLAVVTLGAGLLALPVFGIVLAAIYNKRYVTDLMTQGFVPADDHSRNMLMQKGVGVAMVAPQAPEAPAEPKPEPETLEKRILILAQENGGVLTVSGVSVDAGCSLTEAKAELEALVEAGHVELRSGRNGGLVYVVPELLTDKQSESVEPLL